MQKLLVVEIVSCERGNSAVMVGGAMEASWRLQAFDRLPQILGLSVSAGLVLLPTFRYSMHRILNIEENKN